MMAGIDSYNLNQFTFSARHRWRETVKENPESPLCYQVVSQELQSTMCDILKKRRNSYCCPVDYGKWENDVIDPYSRYVF